MKKTLIALAALASTAAFAQSSVTISGTFDPSFVSQKNTYGNGNSVTQNGLQNNRQGTSQVTFSGTEDLGGGLKAAFLIENDFDATKDATGNIASKGGELYAGLMGGFGSIKLGSPNTPSLTTQTAANPFGTKIGGGFGSMNTGHVRNDNTIRFDTPVFNGFSAAVAYSNKTKADANAKAAYALSSTTGTSTTYTNTAGAEVAAITDIGLFYAAGPVAAGYSNYKVAAKTGGVSNTENNAYVTYDLGVAKVGAGYYTEKTEGSIDSKAYNLSVAMPMGATTLMANYGKKDDKMTANKDRTVYAIGAKYALSKRTSVYGRFVSDKTDNEATATTVNKSTYTIVGLQHNF